MVGVRPGKGGSHEGIGDGLKKEREKHHASLEEVSEALHIPVNQLAALEDDDYSVFSAELYARGAYTAYAKYLGIDTSMSSRAFLRSLSRVRERIPLTLHTPATFFDRLIHPRVILSFAGILLALLVGGYIAWQLESFWALPNIEIDSPVSSVIQGDETVITGTAEDRAHLTVNGENVLLQANARFSVPLKLHRGINAVRIEVKNAAGRVSAKQLFLLRS